jgi:hypothetical protein
MTKPQQSGKQNPMRHKSKLTRCGILAMAALLPALGLPGTAHAQTDPNLANKLLIAILVKKGVLSQSDAKSIMQEVQAEASAAQATAAAAPPPPASPAAPVSTVTVTSTTTPDGTIHVTYIPPIVRNQIASAVAAQVATAQQAQGYSGLSNVPEWVNRVHISGDFRFRDETDLFPRGNDNTGAFPNFNAINTGAPYDLKSNNFPPQLNVDQNRNRFRLRARLGVDADLGEGFALGLRIATGENDSPVSENQTLGGAPSGTQGGNFSKDAIWLDRAYLSYTPELGNKLNLNVKAGRFDNPFFSTNLIWADDLGFDGVAAMASYKADDGLTPFVTGGAFPVYNTDFNLASRIICSPMSPANSRRPVSSTVRLTSAARMPIVRRSRRTATPIWRCATSSRPHKTTTTRRCNTSISAWPLGLTSWRSPENSISVISTPRISG